MIYIVKHKEYDNPVPQGYKELYVGDMYKGMGDNINRYNPYINEATAYYDIWKNMDDSIVGICHYRRFFAENKEVLTLERAADILDKYDMIVCNRYKDEGTLYGMLKADLAAGEEIFLYEKYIEILCAIDHGFYSYFYQNKEFFPREMMVTSREIFSKFCEEFFNIIIPVAELYHRTDSKSKTNPRLLGFITERFFSYLIRKNYYTTYEMEFINI